jgi:HPt (histidine-containing phosphotransfer) domain-containing protein
MSRNPQRQSSASDPAPDSAVAEREGKAQPLDIAHLGRFTLGNPALEAEILSMFSDHLSTYVETLSRADTDKSWSDAAHTLKGSSWAVGAWKLGMLAEAAERMKGDARSGEHQAEAIRAIAAAADEVRVFIRHHVASCRAA